MIAAKELHMNQQISAWNSSYLDHMALLQHEQNYSLPCLPPAPLTSNVAFAGYYTSNFRGLSTGQQDIVGGVLKPVQHCNILPPTGSVCLNDTQCEFDVADKSINASCPPQKRFLIFDRSGSHTRLFFSPSLSPRKKILTSETHTNAADGLREEMAAHIDQQFLLKPALGENWDENDFIEGEGEMNEDTEEINALLYSDSDDYDDDDDDDDEVTSTGHSPFVTVEVYNKDKLLEELAEVANSDESSKRRRLLDGKYKKPSLSNAKSPMSQPVSRCYEDDVESSCVGYTNPHDDTNSSKREKKIKIRHALTTLASIIPGLNGKDPLSVIDKAIEYLKSMKTEAEAEAEALQLSYPGC